MTARDSNSTNGKTMTNGSGAAAILAAAIGFFALATVGFAADKSSVVKSQLIFYRPTGPLSGVTTLGIFIWVLAWAVLEWRWRYKTVAARRIAGIAFALLGLGVLLTFPPFVDLL